MPTNDPSQHTSRPPALSALVLTLSLILGGCHSNPATQVTLKSQDNGRVLIQRFARAYATRNQAGETSVVLVDDGHVSPTADGPTVEGSGPVLMPTRNPPLRQVLYIQILWNAMPNVQADAPSATNAVMDWVVRSYGSSGQPQTLHYQGAGFVWLDPGSQSVRVKIRNATLALKGRSGTELEDPLGNCTMSGTIVALMDDTAVQNELAQAKQDIAMTEIGRTATIEPPARMPGP